MRVFRIKTDTTLCKASIVVTVNINFWFHTNDKRWHVKRGAPAQYFIKRKKKRIIIGHWTLLPLPQLL